VEAFKSPSARLARLFKKSRDAWKATALDKQRRLRAAQVKIRDLEDSRARWKARALAAEGARTDTDEAAAPADEPTDPHHRIAALSPPAGHRYSLMVMHLAMRMYLDAALGSRGVPRVLTLFKMWFPVRPPAYTTVLNWIYRCGLSVLHRVPERREDWIYIADHTIALGPSKCLVILGIPAGALPHTGYSPPHHAMQVLAVEVTAHSTGPWVAAVLECVAQRTGPPVQIVADHGSDLRKGITLFQQQAPACVYTYDISHIASRPYSRANWAQTPAGMRSWHTAARPCRPGSRATSRSCCRLANAPRRASCTWMPTCSGHNAFSPIMIGVTSARSRRNAS